MKKDIYNISVSIPAYELELDTEGEDYEVMVEFEHYRADKEVGILTDGMEYIGWSTKERLSIEEELAIDKYLNRYAETLYSERANSQMRDYLDCLQEMRYERY